MKKNLMSVLILALVLVNTILTAILAIGIIPSVKKSNQLVETVASAINLELNGANGESAASVPMAQIETYDLENEMTINFKKGEDGKDHYVVLKASDFHGYEEQRIQELWKRNFHKSKCDPE